MKNLYFTLILLIPFTYNAQKLNYSTELHQNGKKVKFNKGEATITKEPFALVFKFKAEQEWLLIAGSNDRLKQLNQKDQQVIEKTIGKAHFGGASGYFNESKSIHAHNEEVYTGIEYKDKQHHSFDTIYKKGKWTYGVRTIEKLSTPEEAVLVEDWPTNELYIAYSGVVYKQDGRTIYDGNVIKLNLEKAELDNPLDVRGKTYVEMGEVEHVEGCEGCGNLAEFNFLSNGKQVDFLLSGSDTGSFGDYQQKGNQITIGKEHSFTVSDDGYSIVNNDGGYTYYLKK